MSQWSKKYTAPKNLPTSLTGGKSIIFALKNCLSCSYDFLIMHTWIISIKYLKIFKCLLTFESYTIYQNFLSNMTTFFMLGWFFLNNGTVSLLKWFNFLEGLEFCTHNQKLYHRDIWEVNKINLKTNLSIVDNYFQKFNRQHVNSQWSYTL